MNGTNLDSLLCPLPGFIWKSDLKGSRSIFSVGWSEYTGFSCRSLTDDWLCFVHPDDESVIQKAYNDSCLNISSFRFEYRIRDKNGAYRWFLDCGNPCMDAEGRLIGFAGMSIDVHDLKLSTILDKLTGLYNYAFFESFLAKQLAKRSKTKTALIMADLNNLKTVNDTFGHESGNDLLRAASEILKRSFRSEDAVCRIGGDEFAIVLVNIEEEDTGFIEETLRNKCSDIKTRIAEFNQSRSLPFELSLAIGFSIHHGQKTGQLIKEADKAMYEDKRKSKKEFLA